jgi:hypothetical protein
MNSERREVGPSEGRQSRDCGTQDPLGVVARDISRALKEMLDLKAAGVSASVAARPTDADPA